LQELILEKIITGEEATERLGEKLASFLSAGDVLALYGELGAGKTCLVRGLARGLGIEDGLVASPSFSLINEYPGKRPLFHIDCYRLHHSEEIAELGLEEYFDGPGITVVEWAERIIELSEDRFDVFISIVDESRRKIRITGSESIIKRLQNGALLRDD
jgi:tRNA threonylcarbamoyladenosine biosynthesis protein TsaE